MVEKNKNLFLLMFILVTGFLFPLSFISSEWVDCWMHGSNFGGTNATCEGAHINECRWETPATDAWCPLGQTGCCMMRGCMEYDGNQTACESSLDAHNCTYDPFQMKWYPNASFAFYGLCMQDFSGGGNDDWGGMSEGCWNNDGNKQACDSDNSCSWKANSQNQNPWCWIKTLNDAKRENSFATINDVGCCDMTGCWTYDGNETQCVNNTALKGLCTWTSKINDPYCYNSVGCCFNKWCGEITDESNCTKLKTDLMQPCRWDSNGGKCVSEGGGGFTFFNTTDSCFDKGGWWNASGDCQIPDSTGKGGFMFAEEAHCWFANMQENVCKNITGCVYCVAGNGPKGISNLSNNNLCRNKGINNCEGRVSWEQDVYVNANNSRNLICNDILIKSACQYGPLPNCIWNSSANLTGPYCAAGTSSTTKSAPPVGFCEHPDAVNNYTLCMKLAQEYMMPCKWGNASSNRTLSDNCTFNSGAVFGSGDLASNQKEFEIITSEYSCMASGGTWQKVNYLENGVLKQEQWCEKGAMFDIATGTAFANKGNCDADCWACEFQSNGSRWQNVANASYACTHSALGYCRWTDGSNAPNGQGFCDYPTEMSYGAGDCQTNCKDCDLMQNAYSFCVNSGAGCKWINDTSSSINVTTVATGKCVSQNKKICNNDCFSCFSFAECNSSSVNCQWDGINSLCKPAGYDGEICFDGVDNDGDKLTDCGDPDCSFDSGCGGSSFGDCGKYSYDSFRFNSVTDAINNCTNATAFGNQKCKWINFSWEDLGHCGMPGEDCWTYDWNMTLCGLTAGCTNVSNSGGASNFCDINMSKTQSANCWQHTTRTQCNAISPLYNSSTNCIWVTPEWGQGFCEYWAFAKCKNYGNLSACSADGNCTWKQDQWMDHGFCEVACFNNSLNTAETCNAVPEGICEFKSASSNICVPSTFDMMSGGSGAKMGCPKYDGNYTACILNNYTCIWRNDSNIDNNVTGTNVDGWCNDKGTYEMVGDMKGEPIMLGMDSGNLMGGAESGVVGWADIKGFGLRVTDKSYGFGVGIHNLTSGVVCNGYNMRFTEIGVNNLIGSGLNLTKMKWYLDTDGTSVNQDHCYATDSHGASCTAQNTTLCDFEFYIEYLVQNNSNTGKIETTKKLYQCMQNSSGWQWAPTNTFITDDKKFTCWDSQMGAIFVSVEKESFENFALFNITSPMRIFAVSFSSESGNGVDEVGPGYYTPGTVDFGFIDCSNPSVKDKKCKSFASFGFQTFEECKNGIDDDADGLADCDDSQCTNTPACGGTFAWTSGTNDNKAPVLMFSQVDKMASEAIIMYDTDEPANGTLMFYINDSNCVTLNKTIVDVGDTIVDYDNYKPFHRAILDLNNLGYGLTNNTVYYYKVKFCDPFNNCGTSACLNFTTRKEDKNFILKIDVPAGFSVDIPALNYSGNFTYTNTSLLGTGVVKEIGIKTNSSQTKNMNVTVNYSDMSIKFVGVDVYKPKTLDLSSGAFIVDAANDVMGMNSTSKAWNMLVNDLGLGGSGDYIELNFPVAYSSSNKLNWTNDGRTTGNDVTDFATCRNGGGSSTICKIPTSLGFSAYKIEVPSGSSSSSSSSGSSGGGGGSTVTPTANATTTSEEETTIEEESSNDEVTNDDEPSGTTKEKISEITDIIKSKKWIYLLAGIILVAVIGGIVLMKRNSDPYFFKSKLSDKIKVVEKGMNPNSLLVIKKKK